MSKMMCALLILIGLTSSALASFNPHEGPLLSAVTSFTLEMETVMSTKRTTCYVTSGEVTQCRRKRGMIEKPIQYNNGKLKIVPSAVIGIETTPVPRAINPADFYNAYNIYSSFDDSYRKSQNIFQKLAPNRRNYVTVGDCGMATVNFEGFLSCLGLTVQETTTLTATFRETSVVSDGYTVMTIMGCTPAGFPYLSCPANVAASITATTTDSAVTESSATTTETFATTTESSAVTQPTAVVTESAVTEPAETVELIEEYTEYTTIFTTATQTQNVVTVTVTVTTITPTAITESAEIEAAITEFPEDVTDPTAP